MFNRLKSTAKYDIGPQALAVCSNYPLAAISSNSSIVLFDINSPFEPQLIFHHSSSNLDKKQNSSSYTNLSFHQGKTYSSDKPRYLAASHESSILIYDATGATLNPLIARMTMPYQYKEPIGSLKWYGDETILSCSSSLIALWDMRETSSGSMTSRPSSVIHGKGWIGFAFASNHWNDSNHNKTHQIAVLSADGIVCIFDERKTLATSDYYHPSSAATTGSMLHQFKAHDVAFGIESLGDKWLTWGMDKVKDTVVKVWNDDTMNTDHYWSIGATTTTTTNTSGEDDTNNTSTSKTKEEHQRLSTMDSNSASNIGCSHEHKIENLMTVRPLPDSSEGFVTVSSPKQDSFGRNSTPSMFQTDLWKVSTSPKTNETMSSQLSMDLLLSFQSGDEHDNLLTQMVGRDYLDGHLIGAELSRTAGELILCGLNDKGFFTAHSLPEASVLYKGETNTQSDKNSTKTSPFRYHMKPNAPDYLKVYMDNDNETNPTQDFLMKSEGRRMQSPVFGDNENFFQSFEGAGMQFDLDEENVEVHEPVLPMIIGSTIPATSDLEVEEIIELTVNDEIDMNKAARVPCPRLCGAVFGINGALITFNNGDVKSMWSWYTFGQVDTSSRKNEPKSSITTLQKNDLLSHLEGEIKGSKPGMDSNRISKQDFPKSFLDLLSVNKAAKVAQWGNEADDDGDDEQSANDNGALISDTDESDDVTISDDSSSSDSDESLNYNDMHSQSNVDALYNSYFGGSLDLSERKEQKQEMEDEKVVQKIGRPRGESFALGPVTDTLVRKVYLTNEYSALSLQEQCPELADMWKFGAWDDESIDIHLKSDEEGAILNEREDEKVNDRKESCPRIEILSAKIPSAVIRKRLGKVSGICLHNAKGALEIGQREKADVWNVIAEIVDNHASFAYDDFDRWFNADGSALTSVLLKNILNFYEKQGDFQMLATIVTVLNAAKNASGDESSWVGNILPPDEARFDMYIRTYSGLLYSWGKLSSRAKLNKFLSSSKMQRVQNSDMEIIPFTPCCHSCNLKVSPSSNICTNCRGWAFQCSICTNSVRGLYTFCPICYHGGHTNHILSWFQENSICPTGCGCACVLTSAEDETEEAKNIK